METISGRPPCTYNNKNDRNSVTVERNGTEEVGPIPSPRRASTCRLQVCDKISD